MSDLLTRKPKKAKSKTTDSLEVKSTTNEPVESPGSVQPSTTVRVDLETHAKLKSLRSLGTGKTADDVVNSLIDNYVANYLSPDELRNFELLSELYKKRDNV